MTKGPGSESKGGLGFLLAMLVVPVGAVLGGLVASVTVRDDGLAAGATVFVYLLIGAVVAIALAVVMAVRLPRRRLKQAVWVALGLFLLTVALISLRLAQIQRQSAVGISAIPARNSTRNTSQPLF